jgi:hypothetical protein
MSEPAVQLRQVGAATEEMHGIARQALEWVRISEERLAAAEARAESQQAELKERARATLGRFAEEGRQRVAGERERRRQAESRASHAETGRNRAEKAFEELQRSAEADREALAAELARARDESEKALSSLGERLRQEASERVHEAVEGVQQDADRRVAAAEQRAADAEAAAEEAHRVAVRIEAEIEERVMQGTKDVRREAEERVQKLVAKVEGEAEEMARVRADEQLRVESERIRQQAEQREERARRVAEQEIEASTGRARREVLTAVEDTAPAWSRNEAAASTAGYRTF